MTLHHYVPVSDGFCENKYKFWGKYKTYHINRGRMFAQSNSKLFVINLKSSTLYRKPVQVNTKASVSILKIFIVIKYIGRL